LYEYFEGKLKLDVETLAMRRIKKADKKPELVGRFTGSIFITFRTIEDAEKFMESNEKFRENIDLKKMTKGMYWASKNAENDAKKCGGNIEAAVKAVQEQFEKEKPKNMKTV